tara:strand:- start:8417 stop:9184 length:768 start_codon:yes stop_codon:yes gene_type:complete
MKNYINRRKYLNSGNFKFLLFFFAFLIIFQIIYFQFVPIKLLFRNSIEYISDHFNYKLINVEVIGLERVKLKEIKQITDKFNENSIFLLPLENISMHIKNINWIKHAKLSIDYKNTLKIEIEEYIPVGIYNFNNNFFYFDSKGKIIDQMKFENKINDSLLYFSGKSANLKAFQLIQEIENYNSEFILLIKKIIFVEERRWNILLNNNVNLMLSEKFPIKSLINYHKIINKISEYELNNIKTIDLRNLEKTILINK